MRADRPIFLWHTKVRRAIRLPRKSLCPHRTIAWRGIIRSFRRIQQPPTDRVFCKRTAPRPINTIRRIRLKHRLFRLHPVRTHQRIATAKRQQPQAIPRRSRIAPGIHNKRLPCVIQRCRPFIHGIVLRRTRTTLPRKLGLRNQSLLTHRLQRRRQLHHPDRILTAIHRHIHQVRHTLHHQQRRINRRPPQLQRAMKRVAAKHILRVRRQHINRVVTFVHASRKVDPPLPIHLPQRRRPYLVHPIRCSEYHLAFLRRRGHRCAAPKRNVVARSRQQHILALNRMQRNERVRMIQ